MKHYLKKHEFYGNAYFAFDEENLTSISIFKGSFDCYDNFTDKKELLESYNRRIEKGYTIITREEFNNAVIPEITKLNLILKEL